MANGRSFIALMAYQFRYHFRNRVMLIMNFLLPLGMVGLFGLIFAGQTNGFHFNFLVPGVIVLALINSSLPPLCTLIAAQIQKGILKHLFATPMSATVWILAQVAPMLLLNMIQSVITVLAAIWWFDFKFSGSWMDLMIIVAASSLALVGLALLIAALTKRVESAQALGTALGLLFMFLGGLWLSIPSISPMVDFIIAYIPASLMTDALRTVAVNGRTLADVQRDLISISIFALIALFLAWRQFSRLKRPV